LAVKDAHLFPIHLLGLDILIHGPEGREKISLPMNQAIADPLKFLALPIQLPELPGHYAIHARISLRNAQGKEIHFWQANYPFLTPRPLAIQRLSAPLPHPHTWQAGEMHCHSDYSSDPVEFGAPLQVMQAAGEALGLDFIQITDHSYDFCYRKEAYLEPCSPEEVFADYRRETAQVNDEAPTGSCRLIPGEEVSCGNSRGENVHLLVMGHESYLPGLGDGGRRGLNNRPDLRIEEVLERLGRTPCFAAHPRVKIGRLERFLFRRGPWDHADLGPLRTVPTPATGSKASSPLLGLQFWNGSRNTDYIAGRKFWVESLLQGRRLLPIGANDAHGDLNQNVGVKFPLFSLYRSRSHVLGKVRTLFPAASNALTDIQTAAWGQIATATDGPFAALLPENDKVRLVAESQGDFGRLQKISLVAGRSGDREERLVQAWTPGAFQFSETLDFPPHCDYVRAEAVTTEMRFALTSAAFKG